MLIINSKNLENQIKNRATDILAQTISLFMKLMRRLKSVHATLNMRIVWCHNILVLYMRTSIRPSALPTVTDVGKAPTRIVKNSEYNAPWKTIIIIKIIYCFPVCLCVVFNFCMTAERLYECQKLDGGRYGRLSDLQYFILIRICVSIVQL